VTPLLYSYKETAELLSVSLLTVRRMVADGRLDGVQVTAKSVRVTAESVQRLIQGQAIPAPRKGESL
jgi:excisionase family DNA binding protein